MKIEHQVVSLDNVLRYYANGFESLKGGKIRFARAFVDTHERVVVFELYLQNDQELKPRLNIDL